MLKAIQIHLNMQTFFVYGMWEVCNKAIVQDIKITFCFNITSQKRSEHLHKYKKKKSNFQNQFPTCTAQLEELTAVI